MKHLVSYQRDQIDKDKLTAVASFNWKDDVSSVNPSSEQSALLHEGLTLETSAFQNSLWRLIYPYQLHIDD